jgi:hypothetical protein
MTMKPSDSVISYRVIDERELLDMFCHVCDEDFKKGDLVVVSRKNHSKRCFHRKCFNHVNARR